MLSYEESGLTRENSRLNTHKNTGYRLHAPQMNLEDDIQAVISVMIDSLSILNNAAKVSDTILNATLHLHFK